MGRSDKMSERRARRAAACRLCYMEAASGPAGATVVQVAGSAGRLEACTQRGGAAERQP